MSPTISNKAGPVIASVDTTAGDPRLRPIIELETARLRMRRWRESDRAPFSAMNADPAVMEFFASPPSPAASDASIEAWQAQFAAQGWSNWAVELRESGTFIGFTGLSVPRRTFSFSPCVEVGWRLARRFWGRGFATEAARAALYVAFELLALPDVVSLTAVGNLRSRAVMRRIGMRDTNQDFEHPGIGVGHPLRLHCLYRMTRAEWEATPHDPADRPTCYGLPPGNPAALESSAHGHTTEVS